MFFLFYRVIPFIPPALQFAFFNAAITVDAATGFVMDFLFAHSLYTRQRRFG